MPTTNFSAGTVVTSTWLNEVDAHVFGGLIVTTDYATLQEAVTAAAGKTLDVIGTHTITAAVTVSDNTLIRLMPGAVVQTSTIDIHHFDATGKSNVIIRGPGKIKRTASGSAAYIAGVCFENATDCVCEGVEFEGMQWSGVYMKSATRCRASYNYVHDHTGASIQDSAGIHMSANAVDCLAEFNTIANCGWHGIAVEGIGAGTIPLRCKVVGNAISGSTAYGVLSYQIDAADTYTLIEGNSIRDVTGANPTGSGGAGIYVQSAGGNRVIGNLIKNVCTATTNNTLTPGGIGVNNISTSRTRPVIEGNTIIDVGLTAGAVANTNAVTVAGINVSSSPNGATIGANSISQFAALTTATYVGVYLNACSRVSIGMLNMTAPTTGNASGIFVYANGTNVSTISITSCAITGFAQNHIRFIPAAAEIASGVSISAVNCGGGGASCIPLQLQNVQGYSVAGSQFDATTTYALYVNACTKGSYSGCRFESTGTLAIGTTGTCTGTNFDVSNYWGATTSKMENAGTGFRIEWYGASAIPAAGTWAVGDRAIRVPATGQPVAWTCTTAGTAGVHTSEGNL